MDKIFRELIEKTKNIVATLVYKLISFFFLFKNKISRYRPKYFFD